MVEKTVLDYLTEELPLVDCRMEMPEEYSPPLVVISKIGSGLRDKIKSATIAVQSYGSSLFDAATLNESVKDAMLDIDALDNVSAVRLDSDYPFNDSAKKRYRYQAIFEITHF